VPDTMKKTRLVVERGLDLLVATAILAACVAPRALPRGPRDARLCLPVRGRT